MKKVLFFALLLMILGAASVNSQVRIGGNEKPHDAAILDLNATNATNGNRGIILPRVSLDTTNAKLNGIDPLNGTMVYNTNVSMKGGQGAGLYIWNGKWISLVQNVPVNSIELDKTTLNLLIGGTWTPTVTVAPDNASDKRILWSSSNEAVATVNSSSGVITAVAAGSAVITGITMDGSNITKNIAVTVYADDVTMMTMGTREYPVRTIPGIGRITMTPSWEGTPTATWNGINYYGATAALTACVSPFRLLTSTEILGLANFLDAGSPTMWFMHPAGARQFAGYIGDHRSIPNTYGWPGCDYVRGQVGGNNYVLAACLEGSSTRAWGSSNTTLGTVRCIKN